MADTVPLLDGRDIPVSAFADRVLTHRVTPAEAAAGEIDTLDVDLLAVTLLTGEYEIVPLPPGVQAGTLLAVRWAPERPILEIVTDDAVDECPPEVLAALQSLVTAHGPVVAIDELLWTLWADDVTIFTSLLPPLVQLFDAAGLPFDDEEVAAPGFDLERHQFEGRMAAIADRHLLDEDQAVGVMAALAIFDNVRFLLDAARTMTDEELQETFPPEDELGRVSDEPGSAEDSGYRELSREALAALADPDVADAFLAEAIGAGRDQAAALGLFAEVNEPRAPHRARVALRWLLGKAAERLGRVDEAVRHFDAAESMDPSWVPNLLDLARVASDRGDAERGLSLLRRAGVGDDDDLLRLLQRFRTAERPDLARNDPCWCGSGRKYKACHRGREQQPLEERAAWLYAKAQFHVFDGPWRWMQLELASARSQYQQGDRALFEAVGDPLVVDAVLFEGGAFAEFVEQRGFLLPEDEQLLAAQWLLVERSVFEVEEVRPGVGITMQDLRTGDRHDVRERTANRQLTVGTLLCARIVPADDTMQAFGGIEPVRLQELDELLDLLGDEPEPYALVEILSRRFTPPVLQNTEGDPLLLCRAEVSTPDLPALLTVLDEAYGRVEGRDEPRWHAYVTTRGVERIRATYTLEGDALVVETISAERMDRALDEIRAAHPQAVVLSDDRMDVDTARARYADLDDPAEGSDESASGVLDSSDPQVAAVLDQMVRQYEQAWLDDSIPALHGLTPRQAAADPTRREELVRLLATFPETDQPGLMSPSRLRAELGLD